MQSASTRANLSDSIIKKQTVLLVFTRTPVPGRVKTRLVPAIGAGQATAIHIELLKRTLVTARSSTVRDIELWCAPTARHRTLVDLKHEFALSLRTQTGADLGERMCAAVEQASSGYHNIVLVGSDCIDLTAADIDLARARLRAGYDVVLGPALDGGYYLIGLSRPRPQLFSGVSWGTDWVLRETRERIAQLGLRAYELPVRRDLDRPEDMAWM